MEVGPHLVELIYIYIAKWDICNGDWMNGNCRIQSWDSDFDDLIRERKCWEREELKSKVREAEKMADSSAVKS